MANIMTRNSSPRRLASLFTMCSVLAGVACHRSSNPTDPEAIRQDLESRPLREIYEAYEKSKFTPPDDGMLQEKQIDAFLRTQELTLAILKVTVQDFDGKIESASHDGDRFTRMGTAFSAVGSARNAGLAPVRAALTLGFNPKELDWVSDMIRKAAATVQDQRDQRALIDAARLARDQERQPYLRDQRERALRNADEGYKRWENQLGDAEKANMVLVRKHAQALTPYVRALRAPADHPR
jgi:hypothetical protein